MSVSECIEALQSDLAQYAIARKVDESIERHLKTRVYPLAAFIGAVFVFFGFGLKVMYSDYKDLQARAETYKQQNDAAQTELEHLQGEVATLRASWVTVQQELKVGVAEAKSTLKAQSDMLASNFERQTEATSRTALLAANTQNAWQRTDEAREAAAKLAGEAKTSAENARTAATSASESKKIIEEARASAVDYRQEVATQKKILGLTVIDFALLARKIPSTITLHDPRDSKHPIVLTMTPQSVSKKGFTIDVMKNGQPADALVVDKTKFGQWQELPAAGGLYRYMVDFVYEQRGVRNFVVIRFGGAPELFETPPQSATLNPLPAPLAANTTP